MNEYEYRAYIKFLRMMQKELERIVQKELKGVKGAYIAVASIIDLHFRITKLIEAIKEEKENESNKY